MQEIQKRIRGLYTYPNELSETPEGALVVADNINIDRPSTATPRRGFDRQTYPFSDPADRVKSFHHYMDTLISHRTGDKLARYIDASGWADYSGTYAPPDLNTPIRSIKSNSNLFFTTAAGIKKLDKIDGTPVGAGTPKALDGNGATTGASGFLPNGEKVAYRIVWGFEDENLNLVLGAPSQRIVVENTSGGTRDISLNFTIPAGITTAHFYQIYRSASVAGTPTDELGLVIESNPTSAEITAKQITLTDSVPSELRGATIYTAPSQDGLTSSNDQPPIAKDMEVYRNRAFYLNTTSKHRFYLTMISVGSPSGVQIGDYIIIGGVKYTGAAAENIANREFLVYTGGTASVNIDTTAKSLVKVINRATANTLVYAFYLSGADDLPGQILLEERAIGGVAFYVGASRITSWTPTLPATTSFATGDVSIVNDEITIAAHGFANGDKKIIASTGTLPGGLASDTVYYVVSAATNTFKLSLTSGGSPVDITSVGSGTHYIFAASRPSANDRFKNGLYYSKSQQPEAVPIKNFIPVGSADSEAMRQLALRDSLFILKTDGAYRLTGDDETSFRVDLFDNTARIIAPNSAVVLNNKIYCWSDQGIISISETGVSIVSIPIEGDLLALLGVNKDGVKNLSFGVSYETERKLILWTIRSAADTTPSQAYVFNVITGAWTRWPLSKTAGIVLPSNDKLYLGNSASHYVDEERKTYTLKDHADFGLEATISAVNGKTLDITNTDEIEVGDAVFESNSKFALIESVDQTNGQVTVAAAVNFSLGTVKIYKGIKTNVVWDSVFGENPGASKHFSEAIVLFSADFIRRGEIGFSSDVSASRERVQFDGASLGLWGLFLFGDAPWGGSDRSVSVRTYVPLEKQRCNFLSPSFEHQTAFSAYKLTGIALTFEPISERINQ